MISFKRIVVCLILLEVFFQPSLQTTKLLRWECNTSSLNVIKTKCRSRALARYHQVVDIEFELMKKIDKLKVRYVGMIKPITGQSWRQFLKFDNLDVCAIFFGGHDIEYIKAIRRHYLYLFPSLPAKCPIEKGKYFAKNITIIDTPVHQNNGGSDQFLSPNFPNGIYRHTVRLYTDSDPEGFMVYWHIEMYESMGDDRF